ncbi:MAG TPA: TIGR02450 family Trp-rich protein [Allocoleopsis sp.]
MSKKQKFPHLVGSKWTACQTTLGWRHFQVVNRKNEGQWVFAEMVAACDPGVRFWLNAKQLKNRSMWQAGWQSLQEQALEASETEAWGAIIHPTSL